MLTNKNAVMAAVAMALALVTMESLAGPWHKFEGTPTLVEKATEIVIAESLSDTGPAINGIAPCEAKIVAVIKGDRKPGELTLYSNRLKRGRTYMLTNFGNYPGRINFATNGELAVVELVPDFDLDALKGKSPVEQVQAVIDARRVWIEGELEKLGLEKKLLDKATPKEAE